MRPRAVAGGAQLDGDDPGRGVGQQLAVVADEQDRLRRLAEAALEPDLARHVEEVVGLVEQEHLVGPGEEVLQHQPLLLTAAERGQVAVLRPVVGHPQRGRAAGVPDDLDLVAPGVGELGERAGVRELGGLVVGLHQQQLQPLDLGGRGTHPRGCHREQHLGHGRRPLADHLAHHAQPTRARDRARVGVELAGDDPQQGGLAGAVGSHQRDLGPVADPEGDVVEQHPAVGQLEAHTGDVHVTHEGPFCASYDVRTIGFPPRS